MLTDTMSWQPGIGVIQQVANLAHPLSMRLCSAVPRVEHLPRIQVGERTARGILEHNASGVRTVDAWIPVVAA